MMRSTEFWSRLWGDWVLIVHTDSGICALNSEFQLEGSVLRRYSYELVTDNLLINRLLLLRFYRSTVGTDARWIQSN